MGNWQRCRASAVSLSWSCCEHLLTGAGKTSWWVGRDGCYFGSLLDLLLLLIVYVSVVVHDITCVQMYNQYILWRRKYSTLCDKCASPMYCMLVVRVDHLGAM